MLRVEQAPVPAIEPINVEQDATSTEQGPSPEDIAAHDFNNLLPVFNKSIKYLGKKAAQRVLRAIMEYPLKNNKPSLVSTEEKTAFYYGVQLLDVRFVLWQAVLKLANDKEALAAFNVEYAKHTASQEKKEE